MHTYFFHLASLARQFLARCLRLALSNRGNPWDRLRSAVSPWACESHHAPSPSLSPWKIHCTKARQVHVRSYRVVIRDTARVIGTFKGNETEIETLMKGDLLYLLALLRSHSNEDGVNTSIRIRKHPAKYSFSDVHSLSSFIQQVERNRFMPLRI